MSTFILQIRPAAISRHVPPLLHGRHGYLSSALTLTPNHLIRLKSTRSTTPKSTYAADLYVEKSQFPPVNIARQFHPESMEQFQPPTKENVEPPVTESPSFSDRARYYFHLGKSYGKFYWAGLKRVLNNHQESQDLMGQLTLYKRNVPPNSGFDPVISHCVLYQQPLNLSRRHFQLLHRAPKDFRKLLPFGLVFAVCGEFTPLILPFLPRSILPAPCRLPADRETVIKNYAKRQDYIAKELEAMGNPDISADSGAQRPAEQQYQTKAFQTRELHWGYLTGSLPFSSLFPYTKSKSGLSLLSRRFFIDQTLRHHYRILLDTILIMREGGFGELSAQEIADYCMSVGHKPFRAFAGGPPTEVMRRRMVPQLQAYAARLLDQDFTRIPPSELGKLDMLLRQLDSSEIAPPSPPPAKRPRITR